MANKSIRPCMRIITIKFIVAGMGNEVRSGKDFKEGFQQHLACCVF